MATLKENIYHTFNNNSEKSCPRSINTADKRKKALTDVINTFHSQTPKLSNTERKVSIPFKAIQNLEKSNIKKNASLSKLSSVKKTKFGLNSQIYSDEYYKCNCEDTEGTYKHVDIPLNSKITNEDVPVKMTVLKPEDNDCSLPKKRFGPAKPRDFGLAESVKFYPDLDLDNICKLDDLLSYLDE